MPGRGPPPPPPPPPFPPPYPVTPTAITFDTTDHALDGLWHHGEQCEAANMFPFRGGGFPILIEGAVYRSAWLETQPMGGGA